MAHAAGGLTTRAGFVFPWVFGAREDLGMALGGMAAAFALLAMHVFLGWNMVLVWFVWVVLLDTPHFFATYYRTYLDAEERRTRRALLLVSLAVFLVGPVMLVVSWLLHGYGVATYKLPWKLWGYAVSLWAYFHITRQHYGVLRLYHRRNDELDRPEARLDAAVLYGALTLCFVGLAFWHDDIRDTLGLGPWPPIRAGVPLTPDQWVFVAAATGVTLLVASAAAFQVRKFSRGDAVNVPKLVFLATVIVLHATLCFSGLLPLYTLLAFTAMVTIYHDVQYLGITWIYSRTHYRTAREEPRRFGLAGRLSRSFPRFFVAALVLASVPVWGLACAINRVGLCGPGRAAGEMTFMGDTTWILFFVMLTTGLQMHHYVLDMVIWRPSRSESLRRDFRLDAAPASTPSGA